MGIQAFTKLGNTVTFTADTSAPTAVQAVSTTLGGNQYRIIKNASSQRQRRSLARWTQWA